jgi:hypothetical protein
MAPAAGGGLVIAGITNQFVYPDWDMLVFKINAQGAPEWAVTMGDASPTKPYVPLVIPAPEGGYLVAGSTWGPCSLGTIDRLIVRLDGDGKLLWSKVQGSPLGEWSNAITQVGGYPVVAGMGWNSVYIKWMLTKLDPAGEYEGCVSECALSPQSQVISAQTVTGVPLEEWNIQAKNVSFDHDIVTVTPVEICPAVEQ